MNWSNEIWLSILAMFGSAVAYVVKFIRVKFEEKEVLIRKLRSEKNILEIHKARMEERLIKKTTKSRGKINGRD